MHIALGLGGEWCNQLKPWESSKWQMGTHLWVVRVEVWGGLVVVVGLWYWKWLGGGSGGVLRITGKGVGM